jgi:hypothetical protein
MSAGTRDQRKAPLQPTLKTMDERGSELLDAHMRSLDPGEPIARERLEAELGDVLARKLVFALCLMPLPPGRQIFAP